jgi:hypothetical protein
MKCSLSAYTVSSPDRMSLLLSALKGPWNQTHEQRCQTPWLSCGRLCRAEWLGHDNNLSWVWTQPEPWFLPSLPLCWVALVFPPTPISLFLVMSILFLQFFSFNKTHNIQLDTILAKAQFSWIPFSHPDLQSRMPPVFPGNIASCLQLGWTSQGVKWMDVWFPHPSVASHGEDHPLMKYFQGQEADYITKWWISCGSVSASVWIVAAWLCPSQH